MNLREEILLEHSKTQCEKIVQWVGGSQKRFDQLIRLFLTDEYRVVQRAAWPVSYCVAAHPRLIKKHFSNLVSYLQQPSIPVAVKRNSMRLLQAVPIPPAHQGAIMDLCFQYISNPREAPAVKAFSLTVLENLSKLYPEILPEIKVIIEERWDTETPAFKSRARNIWNLDSRLSKNQGSHFKNLGSHLHRRHFHGLFGPVKRFKDQSQ